MIQCLRCLNHLPEMDEYDYTGLHAECYKSYFSLKDLEGFSSFTRRDSSKEPSHENCSEWNKSFFQGMYKKYSATLAGNSYIVKIKEDHVPELPDVEYACNRIARVLKIDVPEFYAVKLFGQRAFVTKNFITKQKQPSNLTHIFHYIKKNEKYDCQNLIEIILDETKNIVESEKFVEMCLFDSLIGNSDRHGRNIGFLINSNGVRLSPIYDNPSALGLEQKEFLTADWNPLGKVSTKNETNPSASNYIAEFKRLGFQETIIHFLKKVKKEESRILSMIDKSFCSQAMKSALTKLIIKRVKELNNEN